MQDGVDPNDPEPVRSCEEHVPVRPRVPVQSTERQLVAVMPEALVVVDSLATVQYASRPRGASASSTTRRWRSRKSATS